MSNKPHSRVKKVSDATIKVEKKPINQKGKKSSIISQIISTLIKK